MSNKKSKVYTYTADPAMIRGVYNTLIELAEKFDLEKSSYWEKAHTEKNLKYL